MKVVIVGAPVFQPIAVTLESDIELTTFMSMMQVIALDEDDLFSTFSRAFAAKVFAAMKSHYVE